MEAKVSKVGVPLGSADNAGRELGAVDRRTSLRAKGIGARSLGLIASLALTLSALLALAAAPALAARGHVESNLMIGEPGSGPGQLLNPSGVAVNETTGDIYVIDQGNDRVQWFSSTGAPEGEIKEFEVEGAPQTFAFGGEPANGAIAIDNDPTSPSLGDVYVADIEHRVVDKFGPHGGFIGQITEAGGVSFSAEPLDGVAVGVDGALFVYREEPVVDAFDGAVANSFIKAIKVIGLIGHGFGLQGIAVDSERDFYLRHTHGEDPFGRIAKVDGSGELLISPEVIEESSAAVAVEPGTDIAFIENLTSVAAFNPEGVELDRFDFGGALAEGAGIGVDATTGSAYVADSASGLIRTLAPEPPGPPTIEPQTQSAAAVTATSAVLQAEVNPRGAETTYEFEYGPCVTSTTCATSPFGSRTAAATLPADFAVHPVTATALGLLPNTTYHYRVLATNSHGSVEGERSGAGEVLRTFTTQTSGVFTLPDSRQWQLVSPPEKNGALIEPINESGVIEAAAGGGSITYLTQTPTEVSPLGYTNVVQTLSTLSTNSWSTRGIAIPHIAATGLSLGFGPEYKFFDPELTHGLVTPYGQFNPGLSSEASESTPFLHDLGTSCAGLCYRPLVTGAAGVANVPPGTQFGEQEACAPHVGGARISCGPGFEGADDSLAHIVLDSRAPLLEGAGANQLYEWGGGHLTQVSVLPGTGEPAEGPNLGLKVLASAARGAISTDGSDVFWQAGSSRRLYLTDTAVGKSVELDSGCPGCESGGGAFQFADADGSRVFFTDTRRLTSDSGAEPTGTHVSADLYECRIALAAGEPTCTLTDLTPLHGTEGADVQGGVLGAAQDGSHLYYVAQGVVTGVPNAAGESAVSGQPNLYLRTNGSTTFVTALAKGDAHDWNLELSGQPTRVSHDGRYLEFMSERALAGYDNRDASTGKPVAEVYLYDAASARLSCVSCQPTGARPVGVEYRKLQPPEGLVGGPRDTWNEQSLVAANLPGWTMIGTGASSSSRYQPRYLSDSGRLFFNSLGGLVPQDSNGAEDVYEYEPPGVGGCTTSSPTYGSASGGCVGLISAGTSGEESAFLDASENGNDVFFLTRSKLVPQDVDAALDVYDAHVCTAEVPCLPEPAAAPTPCSGEACQSSTTPPQEPSPGSSSFSGDGNPRPLKCKKGYAEKGGKCTKQKPKRKHHHKKKNQKHKGKKSRRANGHKKGGSK